MPHVRKDRLVREWVDFKWQVDGKKFEYSMVGGDIISLRQLAETLHILGQDADITEFINGIADVSFSDENLVKVVPVTEGITASGLRQKYNLVSVYSDELTDAQIEVMNDKEFHAPDLAVVSLDAFSSDEIMTITMNTGEVFKIMVSDAQIHADYISTSGENYEITVTYDASAEIPDHAKLNVSEIKQGTKEYIQYIQSAASKLNLTSSEVSFARFFNIEIVDEKGNKVEPKTPVQVEITYKDSVKLEKEESLKIVHFADNNTEIISDVEISKDGREISYTQGSFSVTGTIVGNTPANNEPQQMILVKDGNRYYIVNNDGSLTEVGYDEASGTVSVTDPMLWTIDGSVGNQHIYFHSEATGFGNNQVASDYFRRYLDPSADNGTTEENRENVNVTPDYIWNNNGTQVEANYIERGNQAGQLTRNMMNSTTVTISSDGLISHGNHYLAIERDAAGTPVRLVGNSNSADAAQFIFATASRVPSGLHLENAVNHIDISIQGDAAVKVPLAYGDYYDAAGNKILTVTENTNLELKKEQAVNQDDLKITTDDMKRATIVAMDKNGNEIDDAFYVTGFSANASTDYSTVQVRIEGRFLCADLRGTEYETINGSRYDGNFWTWPPQWADNNYVNAVRQARLNNIVDYTVTVIKPVTFKLMDPNLGQLYDANGHELTVTMDVAFSGTFNYWDYGENEKNSGNECPPLQGNAAWRQGDIPSHDMSGMDFVLKGDAEHEGSPLVAIEIMKVIRDENGNTIQLAVPVTNTFDIYQNKSADRNAVAGYNVEQYEGENDALYEGYGEEPFHTKSITVGESGSALAYDYTVSNGMYYIEEDKDTVPETITSKDGKEYTYVKTYIETEYVRRGDQYDSYKDPMHVSKEYTKTDDHFRSSPEVVGYFHTLTGEYKKSGFLEYYVYNIYASDKELPIEKVWAEGTDIPEGAQVKVRLLYDKRLIKDSDGQEPEDIADWKDKSLYQPVIAGQDGFAASLVTEMTLQADVNDADKNWRGVFESLPNTLTDLDGNVYEVDYYAEETAVLIPDEDSIVDENTKNQIADYEVNTQVSEGKLVITNKKSITSLDVEKIWGEGTTPLKGTEITVDLYAAKRLIKDENGQTVNPVGEWSEPEKVEGKSLVLKADVVNEENNWKGTFTDLPKTVTGADGKIYELDYSAKEVSVKIPDEGKTSLYENEKEVLDQFDVSEVKTEALDTDESNGKVVITNTKKKVTPKVTKKWDPVPTDSNAYAEVQLKRYMKPEPEAAETEATVIKRWDDNDNHDGKRPASITVTLLKNGSDIVDTVTLDESNGWSASVGSLPVKDGDNKITYTWTEADMPDGYSLKSSVTDGTVTTLTNEYTPTSTSMTVKKIWDDADDQDGKRPESLTVSLKKNGTENVETVVLSEANDWTATIDELPIKDGNGNINSYSWSEDIVPEGYEQTGNTTDSGMTILTNTHTPEKTEASIKIHWDGSENENESLLRPEEIQAELSDGRVVTLNETNNWEATITDLDKYYEGKEISYTWEVPNIEEYEAPEKAKEGTLTNVTYKAIPEKDTVMVTLNTALYENLPEGWSVNIYNVTVNGENITNTLGNLYMTSYSLKPVSFEVPKNSTISYHYEVSNNIRLNGVTSQDTTIRSYNTNPSSGSRDVRFKVKTQDVDIYNVISDTSKPLNEDIPAEIKRMNLTLNIIKADDLDTNKIPYFGMNPPVNSTYRDAYNNTYTLSLTSNDTESSPFKTYTGNNIQVNTDLDDIITYTLSGNYWNMGGGTDCVLTISSPNAELTGTLQYTEQADTISFGIVSQEGDVTINILVAPRSSVQTYNLNPQKASLRMTRVLRSVSKTTDKEVASDGEVKKAVRKNVKNSLSAAPEGYVEDETFNDGTGVRLLLNDENGWTRTFPEQDKYDKWGREYIYYVEEIDYSPEDYQLTSVVGDVLSEEGATITNKKEELTGGLTITKEVTVNNGAVPEENKTIADGIYTFKITGPDNYSETGTITVADGEAESSIVLTGLKPGEYTVTETGSTNSNGITLDTPKVITVEGDSEPSVNVAAFVNNLETTQLSVTKIWSDGEAKHINDQITYKLYKVPKADDVEYDPVEVTNAIGFTGVLSSSNSWSETVTNLPKAGTYTPNGGEPIAVIYGYYVSEGDFDGYKSETHEEEVSGLFNVTITNSPLSPIDKPTDVNIEKVWRDSDGNPEQDKHGNDSITFEIIQKKYLAKYNNQKKIYPVTVNLIDGDGKRSDQSTVFFIPEGMGLNITPKTISSNNNKVSGSGFDYNQEFSSGHTFKVLSVNGAKEVSLFLKGQNDKWSTQTGANRWNYTYGNSYNQVYTWDTIKNSISTSGNPLETKTFSYSMALNAEKTGTVLTGLSGAQGQGKGSDTDIWKGAVTNLPYIEKSVNNLYIYEYEVCEVKIGSEAIDLADSTDEFNGQTSMYFAKWEQDTNTGVWSIINQKKPGIDIMVRKVAEADVDKESANLLQGATFTLEKYNAPTYRAEDKDNTWIDVTIEDSDNDISGIFNFTGLTEGYYQLVETKMPVGYVKTSDNPRFHIKNDNGRLIIALVDSTGMDMEETVTGMLKVENNSEGSILTVGNSPGAELPSTGGYGTRVYTILGVILIIAAGTLLWKRRELI